MVGLIWLLSSIIVYGIGIAVIAFIFLTLYCAASKIEGIKIIDFFIR